MGGGHKSYPQANVMTVLPCWVQCCDLTCTLQTNIKMTVGCPGCGLPLVVDPGRGSANEEARFMAGQRMSGLGSPFRTGRLVVQTGRSGK
jgi:hypothetical protein